MDSKDFKLSNIGFKKRLELKALLKKMFTERNSRPRVAKDILREKND